MASAGAARFLKRGLEVFAVLSVLTLVGMLVYTGKWVPTVHAFLGVDPGWMLLALGCASLDWFGGGIRIWLLARHLHPGTPFWGMIVSGGLNTWAAYITPSQTGGGPVMIWAMRRYGVPLPEALTAAFMSFVATVVFFAAVGPAAVVFGAGRSLDEHGIPLVNLSLYDVFRMSAGLFAGIGAVMLFVIVFPGAGRWILHAAVGWLARHRGQRAAARLEDLRSGIDRMHECVVAFFRGSGWLAMAGAVATSALAHGNKLLAGYVILRALGIEAHFVDVLILQVTLSFLLYFAPTPGGAGAAEALSAVMMSVYVPAALVPAYTILWRLTVSYATVIFGSLVFVRLLHGRLDEAVASAEAVPPIA